jgi:N-acetylglucosaminyldiphosphoundecaprenol N-acetyl-beta-D-mannosaminyltransferase
MYMVGTVGPSNASEQRIGPIGADPYFLVGVRLDNLSEQEVVDLIVDSAAHAQGGTLINPNIDVLRQIVADPQIQALVDDSTLVLADGAPLVWASRIAGSGKTYRVPGADLLWTLTSAARLRGQRVFLLGGAPGVAAVAAEKLAISRADLSEIASYSPPFGAEKTPEGLADIIAAIDEAKPHIVFCAFGFPKQERLMQKLRGQFPEVWFIGSGASIAFAAGEVSRAPKWMRRAGIEWTHRLISEPRRLFRRYVIDDLPFAGRMFAWAILRRLGRTT